MKAYYKLTDDIDLTLNHINININTNEKIPEVPEHLRPTDAMREHFYQNCVKEGILTVSYR